jgi:hypothetical protein
MVPTIYLDQNALVYLHEESLKSPVFDEKLVRAIADRQFNPHFHFETLPPNVWIVAIINIHAGVKAMKTLWRLVPNG